MKIVINDHNKCQIWIFICSITLMYQRVFAERGGFLYFKFLCYQNPGHRDSQGYICDSLPSINCDPYMTICISHSLVKDDIKQENCEIYFTQTSAYDNEESVCIGSTDNRGELREEIKKEIAYPFKYKTGFEMRKSNSKFIILNERIKRLVEQFKQDLILDGYSCKPEKTYYVKIEVKDSDNWQSHPKIASFSSDFNQMPAQNLSNPTFKEIQMYRTEHSYSNPKASLTIAMALQCEQDQYGEFCMTLCRPSATYTCSTDGKKICKEGWKGEECMEIDECVFQSCIPNAKCIEIERKSYCMCDGKIGPQCYPNYNPCSENPCKNEGRCIPNKTNVEEVRCQCPITFHGSLCEHKIDICKLEPCQNNATCGYDKNDNRYCNCSEGFSGKLCDQILKSPNQNHIYNTMNAKKLNAIIILCTLFGISVFICVGIILSYFIRKKIRKMKKQRCLKIAMSQLTNNLSTNNTTIQQNGNFMNDNVYEKVDDHATYDYIKDNNDDYLIPSRPSPGLLNLQRENSEVYLEMVDNFEIIENQYGRTENVDLPPLPSRDLKRKPSLKKFCMD